MSRYGPVGDHRGIPRREPARAGVGLCRDRERGLRDGSRSSETRREEGEKAAGETRPRCRDGGDRPGVGNGGSPLPGMENGRAPRRRLRSRVRPPTPVPGPHRAARAAAPAVRPSRTGPGLRGLGKAGPRGWQRTQLPGARVRSSTAPGSSSVPRCGAEPLWLRSARLRAPALPALRVSPLPVSGAPERPVPLGPGVPGLRTPLQARTGPGSPPGLSPQPPFLGAFPAGPVGGSPGLPLSLSYHSPTSALL